MINIFTAMAMVLPQKALYGQHTYEKWCRESMRAGTLFTVENTELFCNTLQ